LKGAEQIGLPYEVAAEIGKTQAGTVGNRGKGHGFPAALRSELERRLNCSIAFAVLLEHGASPSDIDHRSEIGNQKHRNRKPEPWFRPPEADFRLLISGSGFCLR
jgi:hypothetical protein